MAKQTYTAGQVLTAAQMTTLQTNDYNQTVSTKTASYTLVAADVGTKIVMNAGATNTTITVNTSLFAAGDTLEILNTSTSGICTITAGTATVASSGSLALGLNAGGKLYFTSAGVSVFQANDVLANSGLVFITSATASAAASLSVDGCFTSAYVNYLVRWNGKSSVNDVAFNLRLRASGTDTSSADYRSLQQQQYVAIGAVGVSGSNTATSFGLGGISNAETEYHSQIANPQVTKTTMMNSEGINVQAAFGNGIDAYRAQGFLFNTTSYDGFTLFAASANITGTVYVYGYRSA
jgi:hypothetical protein